MVVTEQSNDIWFSQWQQRPVPEGGGVQDLLRGPGGLRPLRVRPHVPLLPGGKLKIFGDTQENICVYLQCALQQWKGRGGGICPMCREPIQDVIKIYRS